MLSNQEILNLIKNKEVEHKAEIVNCSKALDNLKLQVDANRSIELGTKYLVVKDKIMFHKACLLTLDDLKKEIEK